MVRIIRTLVVLFCLSGCGSSILGPDPGDDPETVFEAFWHSYDRYYAHFELKQIDWDEVYALHRPQIDSDTTEDELFAVLARMLRVLEDGHVYLVAGERRAFSDGHLRATRRNFDSQVVETTYLLESAGRAGQGKIVYGTVDDNIGYVRLTTLSSASETVRGERGWIEDIDLVLSRLSSVDALILDLRSNSGGRAAYTKYVASRFATERRPYLVTRSRNGPAHDDFSEPVTWYAEPNDGPIFDRPVVVLTNRSTFSAAEWLTLALRQYDHVTHMGTHTGGGLAMFLPRELPNGWTHTVSVQDTRCPDGRSYERIGVAPQRYVENGDDDASMGRDTILEEAIKYLRR